MDESAFRNALTRTSIPILVLDQKWHRLFAISGKSEAILRNENALKALLQEQGQLNIDLKNVKNLKSKLMQDIVANMGEESGSLSIEAQSKMDENHRLINEANLKIDEIEDRLLELPKEIKAINSELMFQTMAFCYSTLRTNKEEEEEIAEWIDHIRVELKKNIIKKQNRAINNKEIYYYMHDIFGKDVVDLFDMRFDEYDPTTNTKLTKDQVKQIKEEKEKKEKERREKEEQEARQKDHNKATVTRHIKNPEVSKTKENFVSQSDD